MKFHLGRLPVIVFKSNNTTKELRFKMSINYKTSVYCFFVDHELRESDFFSQSNGIQISVCPYLYPLTVEGISLISNFSWCEESNFSWIDLRIGEYVYTYQTRKQLIQALMDYSRIGQHGSKLFDQLEGWEHIRTNHGPITFSTLIKDRLLEDGSRLVDTYYHESQSLVHWHRCWNCSRLYRQKHQIHGFKHSHQCGAHMCSSCSLMAPKWYFLWHGLLLNYNPVMDKSIRIVHQGIMDIGATQAKYSELADRMEEMLGRADVSLEEIKLLLEQTMGNASKQVTILTSVWTVVGAITAFLMVVEYFTSKDNVEEHQAYNPQDISLLQRAAEFVDAIITLPWTFCSFLKDRWTLITRVCRDLHAFRQGLQGLDFFSSKLGELVQSFLQWAIGRQVFITQLARDKYVRTLEMTASMNTLRTFLDTEVATMLASKIRTEAFLTSHCFVARYVDDYRGEKDSKIRSLVSIGDGLLKSTAPLHRSLFEEEHPYLQYHPYGVAFCGAPGVGKSYLAQKLNSAICRKIREVYGQQIPESSELYLKNEKDQFWPGYSWQFGILIDDLCQNRQSELPAELISLYGDNKTHLNMASLGDKGRSFGSRMIYTTMNGDGFPRPNSLSTPEALWRRRNVLYDVTVNPAYLDSRGRPDMSYGGGDDFWILQRKDTVTGERMDTLRSFSELVDFIFNDFCRMHEQRYGQKKTFPIVRHGGDNFLAQRDHLLVIDPFSQTNFYLLRAQGFSLAEEEGLRVVEVQDRLPDDSTTTLWELFSSTKSISYRAFSQFYIKYFTEKVFELPGIQNGQIVEGDISYHLQLSSYLKTALGLLTIALISGILYYLVKVIWRFFKPDHQSAVGKSKVISVRSKPLVVHKQVVHQASGFVDEAGARVLRKIFGNLVSLSPAGDIQDHRIFGIFLGDHRLLVNRHIEKLFPKGEVRCALALDLDTYWNISIEYGKTLRYGNTDLVVVDLIGQSFQPFSNILRHIVAEGDNLPQPGVGLFARVIDGVVEYETIPFDSVEGFDGPDGFHPYYTYRVNTQAGQCGLPLFGLLQDKRVKVIGIHSLGVPRGGLGMSVPLTKELFDSFVMVMPDLEQQAVFQSDVSPRTQIPSGLVVLGRKDKPIFQPIKSGFQRSPLFGMFGEVEEDQSVLSFEDSRLRGNGTRPGIYGIASYIYDTKYFEPDLLNECAQDVGKFLRSFPDADLYGRILTDSEMINGTNLPHLGHFDLSTSPGFPWKDMRKAKGKYDYFQLEGSDIVWADTPVARQLKEAVQYREQEAEKGCRVESYWVDNLKDEILPLAKVRESKTRVFVNGPLDHTLLCRKYMGGFLGHMMRNRVENFTGPGIVESGPDWDLLYRRLSEKGNNIIDGDHKTWDKHLPAQLMWMVKDVMDIFYGSESSVRDILLHEIIWTVCMFGDAVYMKRAGNVSGCYGTTSIINNVSHLILLTYMWKKAMINSGNLDKQSWSAMTHELYMNVFGDDHILAVSDKMAPFFNMQILEKMFAEYNMVYTTSRKGEILSGFSSLSTCTYLKRTFGHFENRVIGLRTVPEIMAIMNWCRKGNLKELLQMSSTMVCLELWKHGRETYDEQVGRLDLALRSKEFFFHFPTYQMMVDIWRLKTSLIPIGSENRALKTFETSVCLPISEMDSLLIGGPVMNLVT